MTDHDKTRKEVVEDGIPLRDVRRIKKKNKELTEEEVKKLMNEPSIDRDKLLIGMFCCTSLKVGEMSSLLVEDVDLEKRTIRVRAEPAKLGKLRKLPFPQHLNPLIRTWLKRDRPDYLNSHDSPFLFVSRSGGKLSTARISKMIRKYAEKAEIGSFGHDDQGKRFPKVTTLTLRHAFATHLRSRMKDEKSD